MLLPLQVSACEQRESAYDAHLPQKEVRYG